MRIVTSWEITDFKINFANLFESSKNVASSHYLTLHSSSNFLMNASN